MSRECDFKTIVIQDIVIECQGQARPLLRNDESYGATVENNTLTNVSDTDRYANATVPDPRNLVWRSR